MSNDASAWQAVERAALLGASGDLQTDKSDWIRIWCIARSERGLPADQVTWSTEYRAFCVRARQAEQEGGR